MYTMNRKGRSVLRRFPGHRSPGLAPMGSPLALAQCWVPEHLCPWCWNVRSLQLVWVLLSFLQVLQRVGHPSQSGVSPAFQSPPRMIGCPAWIAGAMTAVPISCLVSVRMRTSTSSGAPCIPGPRKAHAVRRWVPAGIDGRHCGLHPSSLRASRRMPAPDLCLLLERGPVPLGRLKLALARAGV